MSNSTNQLVIKNLDSGYQASKVIFNLSLSLESKGISAIVGRNGAGKTTLLQTIMGFIRQTSGNISYGDTSLDDLSPFERTRLGLGYVPQERPVFSELTVEENLLMGASRLPKEKRTDLSYALNLFPKLSSRLDQKAGTMSGGERKMVGIARALIGQPSLLIMDEPTEGVWHGVVDEIKNALITYAENNSVLIVEQNIDFVSKAASKIFLLERGVLTQEVSTKNPSQLTELRSRLTV